MLKVGVIGAGTVGTALAIRLSGRGYHVSAVSSRSRSSAQKLVDVVKGCTVYDTSQGVADNAGLVFITTPDDAIQAVSPNNSHRLVIAHRRRQTAFWG